MKTYKFKYIVTSERLAYVYASDKKKAEEKLMEIMQKENERAVIQEIEEKYVETLNEGHIGIDFGSLEEVEEVDEEE